MSIITAEKWHDFWLHFRNEDQQRSAIWTLYAAIQKAAPMVLDEQAAWIAKFREAPPKPEHKKCVVPHLYQTDDGPDGWRLCQSTSIAMCLFGVGFAQSRGWQDEMPYVQALKQHGDTTDPAAHAKTLKAMGAPGRFATNATIEQVKKEIDAGRPVAAAMLHHGSPNHPSGGHWVVLCGYDDTGWIVCDPYGDCDLASGAWAATGRHAGDHIHYSYKNFNPRWQVENNGSGWCWIFD